MTQSGGIIVSSSKEFFKTMNESEQKRRSVAGHSFFAALNTDLAQNIS